MAETYICMIKIVKLFSNDQNFVPGAYLPLPELYTGRVGLRIRAFAASLYY